MSQFRFPLNDEVTKIIFPVLSDNYEISSFPSQRFKNIMVEEGSSRDNVTRERARERERERGRGVS